MRMDNSIRLLGIFQTGFTVFLVLAIIFLILSVILFVKFDIRGYMADEVGKGQKPGHQREGRGSCKKREHKIGQTTCAGTAEIRGVECWGRGKREACDRPHIHRADTHYAAREAANAAHIPAAERRDKPYHSPEAGRTAGRLREVYHRKTDYIYPYRGSYIRRREG